VLVGTVGTVSPEAGTGDDHHVRLVGLPTPGRRSQQGVAKQVKPLRGRTVACLSEWSECHSQLGIGDIILPLIFNIRNRGLLPRPWGDWPKAVSQHGNGQDHVPRVTQIL
jgi:hypothetical protein